MASKVYLSIEVGDSVVKVCSISGNGKMNKLTKAFMFRTPVGTVSDGMITDPGLLAEKFNEKLADNGIAGIKNAVFSLASSKVATREATLPPVKENRIKAILDANMTEYFPMDISKYQIDYGMVRQSTEGDTKGVTLTLMAAPLTIIDSYVKFAKEAGLIIDAIDYAGNGQFQLMKALGDKKVAMYINVDCQYSFVTIVQNDALVFQRMLPYGGNEFIEAYRDAADDNLDYVDALRASCVSMSAMRKSGILTEDAIEDALSRVVSGITRSMDFFGTLRWKDPLEEVILIGACSRLAGLRDMVADATGHDPVVYLEESPSAATLGSEASLISTYVSAYGSTLHPAKLLPPQLEAGKGKSETGVKKEAGILSLIIPLIVGIIIAGVGGFLAYTEYDKNLKLEDEKKALQNEIARLTYIEGVQQAAITYVADADKFVQLEKLVDSEMMNKGLTDFFEELEEKMPVDVLVLSANCTNNDVTMSIRVLSLEAAAKVLVEFRSFDSLDVISMSAISEEEDETGIIYYAFTIYCRYYIAPEPEPGEEPGTPPAQDNAAGDVLD